MVFAELLSHDQQPVATFLANQDNGDPLSLWIDRKENAVHAKQSQVTIRNGIGSQGYQVLGVGQWILFKQFQSLPQQFSARVLAEPLQVSQGCLLDFDSPRHGYVFYC
jgi:hypothetical protein